jgi:hypothetical protein
MIGLLLQRWPVQPMAEQVQPRLIAMRLTREQKANQDGSESAEVAQVQKQVGNYLKALGF